MKRFPFYFITLMLIVCAAIVASKAQTSVKPSVYAAGQYLPFGAYIGLQVGGHFTESHVNGLTDGAVGTTASLERNGLTGGIQFGYGRAVRRLYIGGEADSNFGQYVSAHVQSTDGGGLSSAYVAHRKFVGTVRARTGFLFGRWLVYGTGGLAVGRLEQDLSFSGPVAVNLTQLKVGNEGMEFGYAAGGGAEYGAGRRLSYVVKSVYSRFQNQTLNIAAVSGPGYRSSGVNPTLHDSGSVLSVGANYHF